MIELLLLLIQWVIGTLLILVTIELVVLPISKVHDYLSVVSGKDLPVFR